MTLQRFHIPKLHKKGAKIKYFDPSGIKEEFSKLKNVLYCKNISQTCNKADLIIIHTEWDEFKSIDFKKSIAYLQMNYSAVWLM